MFAGRHTFLHCDLCDRGLKLIGQLHAISRENLVLSFKVRLASELSHRGFANGADPEGVEAGCGEDGVTVEWTGARRLVVVRYSLITANEYVPADTCRSCRVRPSSASR